MMHPGPRNLITDVGGFRIGNATDPRIKSGVTVLTADAPFTAAVHVMGGAPGTRDTELLAPDKLVQQVNALVLSGGSAFGLDAASGVMAALRARGQGFLAAGHIVPIVPTAIPCFGCCCWMEVYFFCCIYFFLSPFTSFGIGIA